MDALILCGGKGSRLASVVQDRPKPLAPVDGRPFLDFVLDYLVDSGAVTRIALATGHLAAQMAARYERGYRGLPINCHQEDTPLGTGGAVLNALRREALSQPFLLLNGDSFVDAALDTMLLLHRQARADFTLALYPQENAARFGTVELQLNRVSQFIEKSGIAAPGLINAGVYVVDPTAFQPWRGITGPLSLEIDILPPLVAAQRVCGVRTGTRFIDIGLPETYHAAGAFFLPERPSSSGPGAPDRTMPPG
jgi:NDP-sugar pyrophosphorylase family protein